MKTGYFVEGLSNEIAFHAGIRAVENRGAPEACWLLVEGEPGYGKTKTLSRYALHNGCIFVRAKAEWTANWALRDLCSALDIAPAARTMTMLDTVSARVMERRPTIVIDEINHAARKIEVLESLRDITDASETVLIAGGMKGCYAAFNRYQQIRSRVTEVVNFGPATVDDVRKICLELSAVPMADSLVEKIHLKTGGRLRDIRTAIAAIEAAMRSVRAPVTADQWGERPFLPTHRAQAKPMLVASHG